MMRKIPGSNFLGRWSGNIRGSAAIEFAFIAPIFFALMFGIIETGTMFFSQFTLQNATMNAARLIRTGGAASMADTSSTTNYSNVAQCAAPATKGYASASAWFTAQVCCGINALLTCSNLQVDVQNYSAGFGGASTDNTNPLDMTKTAANRSLDPTLSRYNTGAACDVVLVRAFYKWNVVTPGLFQLLRLSGSGNSTAAGNDFLVNLGTTTHLIVASAAFRNEPYTTSTGGC